MIWELKDIERLLQKATQEEQQQMAEILDCQLTVPSTPAEAAKQLVEQLQWKYQTVLGWLARTPTFDEMCRELAAAMKVPLEPETSGSCWAVLARVIRHLFEQAYAKMSEEERHRLIEELLGGEGHFPGGVSAADWSKMSAGALLTALNQFGGFMTYKLTLIVVNQVTKVMLGRGLSLAANATMVRAISIFLGPVGWLLLIWGINDFTGTNWKRVAPGLLFIYCIFERMERSDEVADAARG